MAFINSNRKYIQPVIAIVVIIILVGSFIHFRRYSPYKVGSGINANPEILLSLSDVEIMGRSNGQKKWCFSAKHAEVARGRAVTSVTSIHDGKIYDNGKEVASIEAGKAFYNSATGNVMVSGGIKLSSPQGYKAFADGATWTGYSNSLTCNGKVKFTVDDSTVEGQNLVADLKGQKVTMDKPRLAIDILDFQDDSKKTVTPTTKGSLQ